MDKLTAIKIKYENGTYSDEIPVSVLSENVEWDNTHTLVDVLGSINVDVTGTIQDQISQLFNEKVSNSDMQNYVTNSMPTYITTWLSTNVNPVGSAVVVDSSLTVSGAAADAKTTGDAIATETAEREADIADLKEDLRLFTGAATADQSVAMTWVDDVSISASGVQSPNVGFKATQPISVKQGRYVLFCKSKNLADKNTRVHAYDANGQWLYQINVFRNYQISDTLRYVFDVGKDVEKIRISTAATIQILGLTYNPNIANIERLLGVQHAIWDGSKEGHYYNDSGELVTYEYLCPTLPVSLDPGTYTVVLNATSMQAHYKLRISGFSGDKFVQTIGLYATATGTNHIVFDVPNTVDNVRFGYYLDRTKQHTILVVPGDFLNKNINVLAEINELSANSDVSPLALASRNIGLHVVAQSEGALNAVKRARQMTDIVWTPAGNIPRVFFGTGDTYLSSYSSEYRGTFKGGEQYKGLPYTLNHLVCQEVPLDTFASSVVNKDSVEIAGSEYVSADMSSYYGTVCTGLTAYALDMPYIVSNYWPSVTDLNFVDTVDSLELSGYALGDILQINGHCAIITDIDIALNRIEVSEATRQGNINNDITDGKNGSLCRRIFMPFKQFKTWFSGFSVYRYARINTVKYYPSVYSPMIDEGTPLAYKEYPCIPYLGNKAAFSTYSGAPVVKILIAASGYTHLIVKKDGAAYNEYVLNGATSVDVTCVQAESVFEAYLVKKEGNTVKSSSVSCEWICRPYFQPTVNVSDGNATFTFTVKTGIYKPYFVSFGETAPRYANFIKVYNYTETENNDGTTTYSFTVPYPSDNPTVGQLAYISPEFGMGQLTWHK